jgi:hypothetical protein
MRRSVSSNKFEVMQASRGPGRVPPITTQRSTIVVQEQSASHSPAAQPEQKKLGQKQATAGQKQPHEQRMNE